MPKTQLAQRGDETYVKAHPRPAQTGHGDGVSTPDVAAILKLQRFAGNDAVAELVASAAPASPTLQRDPAATATAPAPAVAEGDAKDQVADEVTKYAGTWPFMAQKQVLAIQSLEKEAGKPHKPTLQEELLKTLAEAALGGAMQGVGELLKGKIEEKIAEAFVESARDAATGRFRGAGGKFITDAAGVAAAKVAAEKTGAFVGEAVKETFAETAITLIKGKVAEQLDEGKAPMDAFFEGQANALVDSGREGFNQAVDKGRQVKSQPPIIGLAVARGLNKAMNAIYEAAEHKQKDETLKEWFVYQAQVDRGVYKDEKGTPKGTDMSAAADGFGILDSPGVLYVKIWPRGDDAQIDSASIKGTTRNFVSLIENKPINQLGIPMIITGKVIGGDDWTVRCNEKGVIWVPDGGGFGRSWLIRLGGGRLTMGANGNFYAGGEEEMQRGARRLVQDVIGSMTLKGQLTPDKA